MMDETILCDTCQTPLLKEELPENRRPSLTSLISGVILGSFPTEHECMVCYFKRADLDGKSTDPEDQKLHKEFIEEQASIRKKRFN
tara:strand:+ start:162 stop:419 length:258 start_codon:yes stop_codon:yes gene_type:complete